MLGQLGIPAHSQFTHEGAGQHGKEVAHIHRHDSQHPTPALVGTVSIFAPCAVDLQQVADAGHHSRIRRPWRIHTQAPRSHAPGPLPYHSHTLLHPPFRNQGRILALLRFGGFDHAASAMHDDVSPTQLLVHPATFKDVFAGEEEAEKGGKDDEKDTGAGIGTGGRGRPSQRVEGGGGGCVEDGIHTRHWGHRGGGRRGRH